MHDHNNGSDSFAHPFEAEGMWLDCTQFAEIAVIAPRTSRHALSRAFEGFTWKGAALQVRKQGRAYEVHAASLPPELYQKFRDQNSELFEPTQQDEAPTSGNPNSNSGRYTHLAELAAESIRQGALKVAHEERLGFVNVLDEAQEAHAALNAVARLAEGVGEDGIKMVRGGDLAALLRIVNDRLGRAIDVAYATSTGEAGTVVALRD